MRKNSVVIRALFTQNPFYLIGTALALYGLRVAAETSSIVSNQPLVMAGILGGMMLLMALAAIAIIKLGGVWDDARTIMLSIMLLIVGVITSCDVVLLRQPETAIVILAGGFLFSIAIWEALLRFLKIWFPADVRIPFYSILAVLFFYGFLFTEGLELPDVVASLTATWKVYLFGWSIALAMLTCLPAIWHGKELFHSTGTPWSWPLFPWSIFVVLGLAACLRLYLLSLAFVPGYGWSNPIGLHFFAPIAFSSYLLTVEGIRVSLPENNEEGPSYFFLSIPVLLFTVPGNGSELFHQFLGDLTETVASPLWIMLVMLTSVSFLRRLLGHRGAEISLGMYLLLALFVGPKDLLPQLSLSSIWPLAILALLFAESAYRRQSSERWACALFLFTLFSTVAIAKWDPKLVKVVCPNLLWLGGLVIGLTYHDKVAIKLRLLAATLAIVLSWIVVAGVFIDMVTWQVALMYVLVVQVALLLSWVASRWCVLLRLPVLLLPCILVICVSIFDEAIFVAFGPRGGGLILAASGCFTVGFLISSYKAGWLRSISRDWRRMVKSIKRDLAAEATTSTVDVIA